MRNEKTSEVKFCGQEIFVPGKNRFRMLPIPISIPEKVSAPETKHFEFGFKNFDPAPRAAAAAADVVHNYWSYIVNSGLKVRNCFNCGGCFFSLMQYHNWSTH